MSVEINNILILINILIFIYALRIANKSAKLNIYIIKIANCLYKLIFDLIIKNTDTLNKEYRFMPETEKKLLLKKCYSIIKNLNKID